MVSKPSEATCILEVHDRLVGIRNPIAWVLLSRTEEVEQRAADGRVLKSSMSLSYQRLGRPARPGLFNSGEFRARFSAFGTDPVVSLTSGAVVLDLHGLEGQRIGTYLMNEIVRWAKQWPQAQVARITLQASDARSEDNHLRRNRLYEQFNIRFDYGQDTTKSAGQSLPMRAGDLTPVTAWQKNIVVREVANWGSELLEKQVLLQGELEHARRLIKERNAEIAKAQKSPVLWALIQLWR